VTPSNSRVAAALAVVVMALSVSTSGQVPGQPQAPPRTVVGTGLIAGQVVDVDTGRGIAGASIAFISSGPAAAAGPRVVVRPTGVITDSQGRFYFAGVVAGRYVIQGQMPGYTVTSATQTFEVTDGERKTDIKVLLRKLGGLSGTVRDDTGAPVVGVEVLALRRSTQGGRPATLLPAARSRTNDRGEYRMSGIMAGEFLICACSREPLPFDSTLLTTLAAHPLDLLSIAGRAATAGADAVAIEGELRTIPPTFHPNTTFVSRATKVVISGTELVNIDIEATAVRGARVSGRIVAAPGAVNASFLRLSAVGDVPEAANVTTMVPMLVHPDGRFNFANVPPGQYQLTVTFRPGMTGGGPSGAALAFIGARGNAMAATPPRGGGPGTMADSLWASELITVGDRDVTGLVVGLQQGVEVTGRLRFDDRGTPPSAQLLQRSSVQLMSRQMGADLRSYAGQLQPDGAFRIGGVVPGRYVVFPAIPVGNIAAIMVGGENVTDVLMDLTAGGVSDLEVVVTMAPPGTIEGRVQLATGDISDQVSVRVFPTDRRLWQDPYGAFRRYKSVRVNPDLTYTTTVPAGEYFLVAVAEGGQEWMELPTLEALAKIAIRAKVADGETVVMEVRR
jgi:hypothetical protein